MKNSKVLRSYLILSGLLLSFIGGAQLLFPVAMKAGSGIDIAGQISVINDIRAANALLLSMALLILSGAFVKKLTSTASLVSFLVFLSMGLGRVISLLQDGKPVEGLLGATALEFVLGITGVALYVLFQDKKQAELSF